MCVLQKLNETPFFSFSLMVKGRETIEGFSIDILKCRNFA